MKRYNIHLDEGLIVKIEKIRKALIAGDKDAWYYGETTRADLIRLALGDYFNYPHAFTHRFDDELRKRLKKELKKTPRDKGV